MKIGFLCDMHISKKGNSPQWQFFISALKQLKNDNITTVFTLGDTVAFGEYDAFCDCLNEMQSFENVYTLLGNSDVRDVKTASKFCDNVNPVKIYVGDVTIVGIHTPYGKINDIDKVILNGLTDGDIVLMHHSMAGFDDNSREFIDELAHKMSLTIIHAHSHKKMDYTLGKSRVVCLRALDPDKSIGGFPCITYYDTEKNEFEEKCITVSNSDIYKIKDHFGISCVDNEKDLQYAIDNNVYGVELRCNGAGWTPDYSLISKIKIWREKVGGYLSVHMPNLKWKDGKVTGTDNWIAATDYAVKIGIDGITMHPPRAKKREMADAWDEFLKYYVLTEKSVSANVNIGIENLHLSEGEGDNSERSFGCVPEDLIEWVDAIRENSNTPERVKFLLDVGHARNNGIFAEKYPISRWYEIIGNKTAAYHIHQVTPNGDNLKNHDAVENWFGPMISYTSFFYCWKNKMLNHVPVFLEVGGRENFQKSILAFEKEFEHC